MTLSGKPPLPGYYCPACGEVRRVKGWNEDREVRVMKQTDDVIIYSHTRAPMTRMESKCPGGLASQSADRAP